MKASPLNLRDYYVTELSVTTNKNFDLQKPVSMKFEDLVVERHLIQHNDAKNGSPWQLTLRVHHTSAPERNAPYQFTLELVGFFDVNAKVPAEKVETILKVNGASMLYGAARQVIRSATAQGPYLPVLLPSVSFYAPKESAPAPEKK
jgi:preprotein translocase subunit SecB